MPIAQLEHWKPEAFAPLQPVTMNHGTRPKRNDEFTQIATIRAFFGHYPIGWLQLV